MLTTIALGTRIMVQGDLVAHLPGGDILICDGSRLYRGRPVNPLPAADIAAERLAGPPPRFA